MDSDKETIMSLLDGCVSVDESPVELDKQGVDYIATLRGGAEVYIDAKTREKGCSRYWNKKHPEFAIEIWSVLPKGKYNTPKGKAGWSIDEAKVTDMILYTFDSSDCEQAFLIPFQSLRIAARRNLPKWVKEFKVDTQDSGSWESKAVFVPAVEVVKGINETFVSS